VQADYIWALKNVNLEIKQGEVVGIIGRNGSGKSTLLKILSRITEPTEGYAEIHGRLGSLLEVGTGFHSELTGRENIFLNGAIIGMKRTEIIRRFDEIVAFSEIDKFLDTPVKHYSSGMYVRLAFAVAAHLDSDILLVDEVLAVGDAGFQRKCLAKMDNAAKDGRTVVLVSHSTESLLSLCNRAIRMEEGCKADDGPAKKVVESYLQSVGPIESIPIDQRLDRQGDGSVKLIRVSIESTEPDKVIRSRSGIKIKISYSSPKPVRDPQFYISVLDYATGVRLFIFDSDVSGSLPEILPPEGDVLCLTDPIDLSPGRCFLNVSIDRGGVSADYVHRAATFDVEAEDVHRSQKIHPHHLGALCVLKNKWLPSGKN
jgi:lipopolysaccharide transport system ATP-binding protein